MLTSSSSARPKNTVLIAGATGVIGAAALARFASAQDWQTIAVSRRTPETPGNFKHLSLDLRDASACQQHSRVLSEVTHFIYAAVTEQPGLISGWRNRELMQTNLDMFRNLLKPLSEAANGLQHVSLLQGAKAYGAHAGSRSPLPAREDEPRAAHENFYWLQEDYLRAAAQAGNFAWTIFRPQVVVGSSWGAANWHFSKGILLRPRLRHPARRS
jgi:nucleoside-diphosphate-sugar epimerase